MKQGNDDALFERPVAGDQACLRPLVERNCEALCRDSFQKVYSYAYYRVLDPVLTEDLTSIVFMKAVENFARSYRKRTASSSS